MRTLLLLLTAASLLPAGRKLTDAEKIELIRGLTAEQATLKVAMPRSKKPLPVDTKGQFDKKHWDEAFRELGPAGRVGDAVIITKVGIDDDRILLEINGGVKSGRKWYERIEVGMGTRTTPIGQGGNPTAGSNLALVFPDGVPPMSAAEIKKMLAPVLDFDKRSATEQYITTLPPEIQQAVKDGRVVEGMDRETVLTAVGRPRAKSRETRDGVDYEDWVYGTPPGKITFVTFQGAKVVKVKDSYAGLGGSTVQPLPPR